MAEDRRDATRPAVGVIPRATADEIREQQAIAAAMMIGEQSRREDQKQIYWYTKRIGIFTAVLSVLGLLILLAYSSIRKEYNPTLGMLAIAAVGAAGVTAAFWAHVEARRE